jgi:hypothetical protein
VVSINPSVISVQEVASGIAVSPCQKAIADIGQVAANLVHPGAVRLRRDAGDVDAARGQVDELIKKPFPAG